jgi:hypothetical protein
VGRDHRAAAPAALTAVITAAATLKANLVSVDERERTGRRALLNLGHTVGHAIEAAADWRLLHGEAVALGLVAMARISARLGLAEADLEPRVVAALAATGLPTDARAVAAPRGAGPDRGRQEAPRRGGPVRGLRRPGRVPRRRGAGGRVRRSFATVTPTLLRWFFVEETPCRACRPSPPCSRSSLWPRASTTTPTPGW